MNITNRANLVGKVKVLAILTLATVITGAHATAVYGEAQRKADNTSRVAKLNPYMQPKVKAILTDLESHGYRPLIDNGVWRTPAQQAAKLAAGVSTVSYSFHNASKAGKADSLAADITDIRWGWDNETSHKDFWLKLAASAESHNLTTGIYWGTSDANRKAIHAALAKRNWAAPISLGWDQAHVEPTGITLSQAKRGLRPYLVKGKEVIK